MIAKLFCFFVAMLILFAGFTYISIVMEDNAPADMKPKHVAFTTNTTAVKRVPCACCAERLARLRKRIRQAQRARRASRQTVNIVFSP